MRKEQSAAFDMELVNLCQKYGLQHFVFAHEAVEDERYNPVCRVAKISDNADFSLPFKLQHLYQAMDKVHKELTDTHGQEYRVYITPPEQPTRD